MTEPAALLRDRAEQAAGHLPPLLAEARQLAATVLLGEHGRRRAGMGAEFWQYRPAHAGDPTRAIDWRRSARSDAHFVREMEWQAAQSVMIWVDRGQSMNFASADRYPMKSERASILGLAAAVLLSRAGERIGLTDLASPPQTGELQLNRIATALMSPPETTAEYGAPSLRALPAQARALFLSDFLGDLAATETALTAAADRGVRGALVQVLDPQEEAFPFDGRTIFESVGRGVSHETQKARDLRSRYLDRLAERKHRLAALSHATGWHYLCHHTDDPAQGPLLWLYGAIGGQH